MCNCSLCNCHTLGMQAGLMQKQKMQATVATFVSAWCCYMLSFEPNSCHSVACTAGNITFKIHKTTAGRSMYKIALTIGTRKATCRNRPYSVQHSRSALILVSSVKLHFVDSFLGIRILWNRSSFPRLHLYFCLARTVGS